MTEVNVNPERPAAAPFDSPGVASSSPQVITPGDQPPRLSLSPCEVRNESAFANISVRAWLAIGLVATICLLSAMNGLALVKRGEAVTISEPLYSMGVLALGFYFGQKNKTP